jgi:hypothetical protein
MGKAAGRDCGKLREVGKVLQKASNEPQENLKSFEEIQKSEKTQGGFSEVWLLT